MVEEIDIWRTAGRMCNSFGSEAAIHAAKRAEDLFEARDLHGSKMWLRIVAAIAELQRMRPNGVAH